MKLHTEHLVDCSADELWDLTFSADFDVASNLEANGMKAHTVKLLDRSGETWRLESRSTPATSMPKFVQRWIDEQVFYDTVLLHVPGTHLGEAVLSVSLGGQYVTMTYRMVTEPVDESACKRIFDWEVKVYGVGSLVERFILGEIERGVEKSAHFVNDWIARRRGRAARRATTLDSSVETGANGRLRRPAAEVNLTEHCNLSCAGCNHASHLLGERFANLETIERDLAALAPHVLFDELKIVGGEPLLHPQLVEILRAARRSGVASELTLVTNGVLVHKMPDEVLWLIDRLWVSRYPGVKVKFDLPELEEKCRQNDVLLWHKETSEFSLSLVNRRIDDERVVREVYDACAYAHVWSCHTIYEGRYYKCSPAPFVPARQALLGRASEEKPADYVDLHAPGDLRARLEAYLASPEPLSACHYCLGHLGRDEHSRQLNKKGLREELAADHSDLRALFHPERRPKSLPIL